ncbi:MAG: hypothetical protein J6K61_05475 [Clostridia bacterium]|nr:hypothetical protein [Clostridia bacterium]
MIKHDKKRFGILLFLLAAFLCLLPVRSHAVSFTDTEQTEKEPPAEKEEETLESLWSSFWNGLPDLVKDAIPQGADSEEMQEKVGFTHLFSMLASSFTDKAEGLRPQFLKILGLTLLFSVAGILGEGKEGIMSVMTGAFALFAFDTLEGGLIRVTTFLEDIGKFSVALSPLFTAVFASGGAEGTAATTALGFGSFLAVLEGLCLGVLVPLLRVLFVLALVSSLGKATFIGELSGSLRGFYLFSLSLLCCLLTASLAFQTHFAAAADSVAVRTVKFAIGNAVPVVGGTVSTALGSITASLSYIKSTLGASSVVALCLLFFPVLAELFLMRLCFSLCASLANMLEAPFAAGVLTRFRGLYDLMLATAALVSLLFLLLSGIAASASLPLS